VNGAIVTGGSRGIGLAIAQALVSRGDNVCVTGRDTGRLSTAVAELNAAADKLDGAGRAIGVAGKAHDEAHQAETVAGAMAEFGRIDFLVNNVATNPVFGPAIDAPLELVRKILEVNLVSAFAWTQRVYAAWLADHGGAIVNVSSVAGLRPAPGLGLYGMTKAALSYLTAQLAFELAPQVRVNAVAPAVVKTKFAEALYIGRESEAAAGYPLGRLGDPVDVAGAVAFLLSDDASWITGQTVVLDGGATLVGGFG
jgi:3-oxoacyl-[acyl-carrier protein] reductase